MRLASLALLMACASPAARPEIILVVDGSMMPRGELDHVDITVVGPAVGAQYVSVELASQPFPLTLDLLSYGNDRAPTCEIRVVGSRGGTEVVRREVRTRFVTARRILLRVELAEQCVFERCAPGMTCDEGGCTSVEVDPVELADFNGEIDPACARHGEERCNMRDDDCDGNVDEIFDLATDRENCGSCRNVCAARCATSMCEGARIDGLAGGGTHACAFTLGAGAWCWGSNFAGELGSGAVSRSTMSDAGYLSTYALPVVQLAVVDALAAGGLHSCAISRGEVHCWGSNADGQLGDGTTIDAFVPVMVPGVSMAEHIALGAAHTCVIAGGMVSCWGRNDDGQLGRADTAAPVPLPSGTVSDVTAGGAHSCAIVDGAAHCWGANDRGQLGDGTMTGSMSPRAVSGLSDAIAIAAGASHTCAVRRDGSVMCWGGNDENELGEDATMAESAVPVMVRGPIGCTNVVASLGGHSCAWGPSGAWCWGSNLGGQIGHSPSSPGMAVALPVVSPVAIAVGGAGPPAVGFTCAVDSAGLVLCWGVDEVGQVGGGARGIISTPARVQGLP